MNHPFIRFIAAVLLSIVTSLAIRTICLLCFVGIVDFFANFSFMTMFITGLVASIGTGLFTFIVPLLLMGLRWAGNGSKWIAVLPILVFIHYFVGDCVYLFSKDAYFGESSEKVMVFLRDEAGWFYTPGAVITAIVMLVCYLAASYALLTKEN